MGSLLSQSASASGDGWEEWWLVSVPSHSPGCCIMERDHMDPRAATNNARPPPPHHGDEARFWRRKWQPTPVFLPGKSHGQRSLVGYCPWGRKESDMTDRREDSSLKGFVGRSKSLLSPLLTYLLIPATDRQEVS